MSCTPRSPRAPENSLHPPGTTNPMILPPDPAVSVLPTAQAPRAPEDAEQQDPRALGPSSERPTAPPLHCAGSQKAGTYHGRCPWLCRGGQARARGHSGDQAGLGSRRWLGGAGGPWGQRGGLGLAVGGTGSRSGLLKGADGRDCGRHQGKRWGQVCGERPGCPHPPCHIPAQDSQRGPSPAFWFLAASTAFWAATWAALRFPGTWR